MGLADLPRLDQARARRQAVPKGETRRDEKIDRQAEAKTLDTAARNEAWKRCKGRCEKCERRIVRGGGLVKGAQFHHRRRPATVGADYLVLCKGCHFDGPSGAHTRTR